MESQSADDKDAELEARPQLVNPDLEWLARLSVDEFRHVFRGSPVKRARFNGLRRTVAVAMGNSGDRRFLPCWRNSAATRMPLSLSTQVGHCALHRARNKKPSHGGGFGGLGRNSKAQ